MRRRARSLHASIALAAALLAAAQTKPASAAAHPLLAAGEAKHYLYPLGTIEQQEEIVADMAMLSMLSRKTDADGKCLSDACVRDLRDIYGEMALGYSRLGLKLLALRFYRAAANDAPDDANAHYNVAVELEATGLHEAAEKEYGRALELAEAKDKKIEEGAARFFLLSDRLDEARTHFERCILIEHDAELTQYCAIGLILTKIHGGNDSQVQPLTPAAEWPGPLLSYLRKGDEKALAAAIAQTPEPERRRQRLCEALYYAGERELQLGRRDAALRFFRAGVAQRVESFWENAAAKRRIEQLHGNDDPPPPPPPPASHVPIG